MLRLTLPNELPGERREQAKQKVSSHQLRDTARGWRPCDPVQECEWALRMGLWGGDWPSGDHRSVVWIGRGP